MKTTFSKEKALIQVDCAGGNKITTMEINQTKNAKFLLLKA
jgi:hypothetical protein